MAYQWVTHGYKESKSLADKGCEQYLQTLRSYDMKPERGQLATMRKDLKGESDYGMQHGNTMKERYESMVKDHNTVPGDSREMMYWFGLMYKELVKNPDYKGYLGDYFYFGNHMDYEDKIEALKLVKALELKFTLTHDKDGAHGSSAYSLIPSTTEPIVQYSEEQKYIYAFFERFINRALETLLYELEMPALNEPGNEENNQSKILTDAAIKRLEAAGDEVA